MLTIASAPEAIQPNRSPASTSRPLRKLGTTYMGAPDALLSRGRAATDCVVSSDAYAVTIDWFELARVARRLADGRLVKREEEVPRKSSVTCALVSAETVSYCA